jgi:hypothetical protein
MTVICPYKMYANHNYVEHYLKPYTHSENAISLCVYIYITKSLRVIEQVTYEEKSCSETRRLSYDSRISEGLEEEQIGCIKIA